MSTISGPIVSPASFRKAPRRGNERLDIPERRDDERGFLIFAGGRRDQHLSVNPFLGKRRLIVVYLLRRRIDDRIVTGVVGHHPFVDQKLRGLEVHCFPGKVGHGGKGDRLLPEKSFDPGHSLGCNLQSGQFLTEAFQQKDSDIALRGVDRFGRKGFRIHTGAADHTVKREERRQTAHHEVLVGNIFSRFDSFVVLPASADFLPVHEHLVFLVFQRIREGQMRPMVCLDQFST